MADAMLHKEKGDKTPKSSFEDDLLRLDEDELAYEGKGKGPIKEHAQNLLPVKVVQVAVQRLITRTLNERLW